MARESAYRHSYDGIDRRYGGYRNDGGLLYNSMWNYLYRYRTGHCRMSPSL